MKIRFLPLAVIYLSIALSPGSLRSQAQNQKPMPPQKKPLAALSPQDLFKRLSPSIFVVEVLNQRGTVIAFGSGVSIAPNVVITNNHVVQDGASVRVRQGSRTWPAVVTTHDDDNDLCRLEVFGLKTHAVTVRSSSSLVVGERVYSIGAPEGLELTFSEGLISGFRKYKKTRVIQTTAAISRGSSGGGLFDSQGQLAGITTFFIEEGQSLNFAVPSEAVLALKHEYELVPIDEIDNATGTIVVPIAEFDKLYPAPRRILVPIDKIDSAPQIKKKPHASQELNTSSDLFPGWKRSDLFQIWEKAVFADNYAEALKSFSAYLKLRPEDADIWRFIGLCYQALSQTDSAIFAYQQAIRIDPRKAQYHIDMGEVYLDKKMVDESINCFREAVRLEPEFAGNHDHLAQALRRKGNFDAAIKELREVSRLEPDNANCFHDIGEILRERHDLKGAIEQYYNAIRLNAGWFHLHSQIGECFLSLGDRDGALAEYGVLADSSDNSISGNILFDLIIEDTTAPGSSNVLATQFEWQDGFHIYSFSIHNRLLRPITNVHYLVVFYGSDGKPIDTKRGMYKDVVLVGLAARITDAGDVHYTVRDLSSTVQIKVLGYRFAR